ncbi:c3h4 type zinc finger protein [Phlyctema vagabunda]|uniref:C3h4 type zinc finger protein n=1 Tax=Phlyctema vagabunda TaxID=108571 RepID=A0ABR4PNW5_9HELO
MNQMDFTMESEQPHYAASRCPYFHQMARPVNHSPNHDGLLNYDSISNRDARYTNGARMSTTQRSAYSSNMSHLSQIPPPWVPDSGWYGYGDQQQQHQSQHIPQHQHPNQLYQHHQSRHHSPHRRPPRSPGAPNSRPHASAGGWNTMSNNYPLPFGYGFGNTRRAPPQSDLEREAAADTASGEVTDGRVSTSAPSANVVQAYNQSTVIYEANNRSPAHSNATNIPSEGPNNSQSRSAYDPTASRGVRIAQAGRLVRNSVATPSEELRAPQHRSTRGATRSFQSPTRRHRASSTGSSEIDTEDDDSDDLAEHYHHEIFLNEEAALATMRGLAAHGKPVASQSAIASLEKVDMNTLTDADRTCIICYNDFNIQNPEGIMEFPLRLPKCKHVFGDKCIKKWFQDSDTCPYCRDKLPSESSRPRLLLARLSEQQAMRSSQLNLAAIAARNSLSDEYDIGVRARELASSYQGDLLAGQQGLVDQRNPPYSPNRSLYSESSDVRRRRGRLGVGRALPPPTRQITAGPSRFAAQQGIFRNVLSNPVQAQPNRTSFTSRYNLQIPIQNGQTSASSSEGMSPPVAVGSSSVNTSNSVTTSPASDHPSESRLHSPWHDSALEFLTRDEHNIASQRPTAINNSITHDSSPPRLLPPSLISPQRQHTALENNLLRPAITSDAPSEGPIWADSFTPTPRIAPFQYPRWSG